MKNLFLTFLLIIFTIPVPGRAQRTPEQLAGVYRAYQAPGKVNVALAPKGFHLIYVSHYGRHGSRWVTNDARYEWVLKQFDNEKNLTRQGKKLRALLLKVYANAKGNGGKLTPLGAEQQQGIAKRMEQRFPTLFANLKTVNARSSVVGRCRKSMEAFMDVIKKDVPQANISIRTDSADMRWISYDSPDEMLLKMETNVPLGISPDRFISSLFKDTTVVKNKEKLLIECFTIASDMQDVSGLNIDLYPFFTQQEMEACYQQNCRKMWFENGLDPANHGIPAQCAANLWKNIVSAADSALALGGSVLSLRFGHDTALYRLLSLLGSKTVTDQGGENLSEIVPMASNLQMAFFKNDADSVIVSFWLNEKPMYLNADSLYYPWSRLKAKLNHYIITQKWKDRVNAVNTMDGTAYATTHSAGIYGKGSEEHGQTLPAVLVPHGMTFWTPQTRDTELKCIAPFYYPDSLFQGFRASHWIVGGCTQDYGSFTLMPEMGKLRLKPLERATPFSHAEEFSHPHYYGVWLPKENMLAEMTATSHCAMFRFIPYKDGEVHIVLNPNSDEREGFVAVDTTSNCIWGYNPVHRIYQGWGEPAGFKGWFIVKFKNKIRNYGVKDTVAYVSFDAKKGDFILAKAAMSFTSKEGAELNFRKEMPDWDFLGARLALDSIWQRRLNTIDVEDNDKNKVNEFYGALYRCSFLPHETSDVDGKHPKFGSSGISTSASTYYDDYSMWDIYRAELPLLTIIDPKRMGEMMQSLVTKYEEGGWMPIFPCWNSYTAAMIGDHAAAALADAYVKGIKFDINKAYEGIRKNAFIYPSMTEYKDGKGRRALKSYLKYGYIPLEDSVPEAFHNNEQVSRTLEYAYDDFCTAQLAKATGHINDYNILLQRSNNWKNIFNPKTRWIDGRYARKKNGSIWLNNKDLIHRQPYITEGTVMHYSFYVPQDVEGLIKTMGGRKQFTDKLDMLFGLSHNDSIIKRVSPVYYWHGNEPCHQIPYLYALAGQPRKTQWLINDVLNSEYNNTPGGLSGNDDAGQMSAWYIFSSLGFYPVCPGKPEYVIGNLSFDQAHIGNLTIKRIGDKKQYIKQVLWNGKPYSSPIITHEMITNGGILTIIH